MPCLHSTFAPAHVLTNIKDNIHDGIDAEFGAGRQKCAALAYEQGFAIGQSGEPLLEGNDVCPVTERRAPVEMLVALPNCQAGEGRHVCCVCAYHEGFVQGRLEMPGEGGFMPAGG